MSDPSFGCQNQDCATEVSYPADMLALWKDEPICEECYYEASGEDDPSWSDLPAFIPAADKRIGEMEAENERLRAAIERLGSNEALTLPFMLDMKTQCGKELDARLTFARTALAAETNQETTNP